MALQEENKVENNQPQQENNSSTQQQNNNSQQSYISRDADGKLVAEKKSYYTYDPSTLEKNKRTYTPAPQELKLANDPSTQAYLTSQAKVAKANTPMDDEKLKKLQNTERKQKLIASIADTARAMSNLFATNKYAPNIPQFSLADKYQAMFDKAAAKRKESDNMYYTAIKNIADKGADIAKDNAEWWKYEDKAKSDVASHNLSVDKAISQGQLETNKMNAGVDQFNTKTALDVEKENNRAEEAEKKLKESYRHNKAEEGLRAQGLSIQRRRVAIAERNSYDKDNYYLMDKNGNTFTVSRKKFNDANIDRIFNSLPAEVRRQYGGAFRQPTKAEKINAIGVYGMDNDTTKRMIQQMQQ